MQQITSTPPASFWVKHRTAIKIFGLILIIWGVFTLFVQLDVASSPYTSIGSEEYLAGDITSFWTNFSYIGFFLLVGMVLFQKKIRVWSLILVGLGLFMVLLISGTIGTYNSITLLDQQIQEQLGNIKASYQLRLDIVPDLISVAREPLAQEKDIQMKLAEARGSFSQEASKNSVIDSANKFEQALGKIMIIAEAYPNLRETKEFQNAQDAVSQTGAILAIERVAYNERISSYNIMIKSFPMSLFARLLGFLPYEYWSDIVE